MTDVGDHLSETAMALLREHGPLSTTEWAQLLVSQGHGFLGEMTEVVEYLEHPLLGTLPDRRHIALDTVLDGRVLTHRLTEAEIASGIVDAKPDLVPLTVLVSAWNRESWTAAPPAMSWDCMRRAARSGSARSSCRWLPRRISRVRWHGSSPRMRWRTWTRCSGS